MSDTTTASPEISTSGQIVSQPFKTAVQSEPSAPTESKLPESVVRPGITPETANPILSDYRAEKGAPYANEYFELGTPYDFLPSAMQKSLDTIDSYVEQHILEQGLKPTISRYDAVINELKNDLVGGEELSLNEMIERLSAYARNMLKLDGIDDIKQELKRSLRRMSRGKDMDAAVLKAIGKKIL